MISEKGLTATARHHLPCITLARLLPGKGSHRWKMKTSLLTLSRLARFLSTSTIFLFLLSCCLLFVPLLRQLSAGALPQRLIKPKNILLYHLMSTAAFVSLSTCCSTELIWFSTMWFVYLYVIVWAIYAASTLEAATLNTNLLCSVAVPLPLPGYLPLLDGSQTQIYGWRLK